MTTPLTRFPRRLALVALAAVQVLVLLSASAVAATRWIAAPLDDGTYVLLVVGSDAGPPRPGSATTGRADAIQLVVVPEDRSTVSIVSIPRDSWVPVRGHGRSKINAGLTNGPEAMAGTIEDLTGLEVDDWVVTGFDGFVGMIDTIGGVHVDVEQRLNDNRGAHSNLHPGPQTLDGTQALAYTRDRKSRPDGDLGRNRAQARVLQSVHAQLAADGGLGVADLVELAAVVRRHTRSSIPPGRLLKLAALAAEIPADRVALEQAGARVGTAGRASVVHLTDAAFRTFADLRDDGRLSSLPSG